MTLNERLYFAGLIGDGTLLPRARDRAAMLAILKQVGIARAVDSGSPIRRYGFWGRQAGKSAPKKATGDGLRLPSRRSGPKPQPNPIFSIRSRCASPGRHCATRNSARGPP